MRTVLIVIYIITQSINYINANDTIYINLTDAIEMAKQNSPDANNARHTFLSEYWSWRSYKSNYLPMLSFSSSPYYDRAINAITQSDGNVRFIEQNLLRTNAILTLSQNINITGGNLFIKSSVDRIDILDNNNISYQTIPVTIGYSQSLFGYNSLKWNKKLYPVKYESAKKELVETLELVASNVINKFFNLATAQSNYESAIYNYNNTETLFKYAKGRYEIGTITENEMLQLEINMLSEETEKINSLLELRDYMQDLRSYLGISDNTFIKVVVNQSLPELNINEQEALSFAMLNSPDILNMKYREIQSESNVAYARANAGLKADIYMSIGLTQTAEKFKDAYKNPLNQQYVSLGVSFPILDWGNGRGKIKVAQSNKELISQTLQQRRYDFEVDIIKTVNRFNLQIKRVEIAYKTNITASKRFELAHNLYLQGKSTVLDLNVALSEKDSARRNYISAIYKYWNLLYVIRSMTLYDFENNIAITENLNQLLN